MMRPIGHSDWVTLYKLPRILTHTSSPSLLLNPAKGDGATEEEIQQYEELNKERGIPPEHIEDLTQTDKAKRTTGTPK